MKKQMYVCTYVRLGLCGDCFCYHSLNDSGLNVYNHIRGKGSGGAWSIAGCESWSPGCKASKLDEKKPHVRNQLNRQEQ
eukprot:5316980-Amphidinium_carterae.1